MSSRFVFSKDILKGHCKKCNFDFFTHYPFKVENGICSACDPNNENNKTVRSWEN